MYDNYEDNQRFIDDARARGVAPCKGLDTFVYHDPKSREFMLVAGHPDSIRLPGEIIDDYESLCGIGEAVDVR